MIKLQSHQVNHPPILIHRTELGDRLVVWHSVSHPENLGIKEDLRELGYPIETFGDVYIITDPYLNTTISAE